METVNETSTAMAQRRPWNKGKLIGPKPPLQPKLRGCDVVSLMSSTSTVFVRHPFAQAH
jgi:hypothetical protein